MSDSTNMPQSQPTIDDQLTYIRTTLAELDSCTFSFGGREKMQHIRACVLAELNALTRLPRIADAAMVERCAKAYAQLIDHGGSDETSDEDRVRAVLRAAGFEVPK